MSFKDVYGRHDTLSRRGYRRLQRPGDPRALGRRPLRPGGAAPLLEQAAGAGRPPPLGRAAPAGRDPGWPGHVRRPRRRAPRRAGHRHMGGGLRPARLGRPAARQPLRLPRQAHPGRACPGGRARAARAALRDHRHPAPALQHALPALQREGRPAAGRRRGAAAAARPAGLLAHRAPGGRVHQRQHHPAARRADALLVGRAARRPRPAGAHPAAPGRAGHAAGQPAARAARRGRAAPRCAGDRRGHPRHGQRGGRRAGARRAQRLHQQRHHGAWWGWSCPRPS